MSSYNVSLVIKVTDRPAIEHSVFMCIYASIKAMPFCLVDTETTKMPIDGTLLNHSSNLYIFTQRQAILLDRNQHAIFVNTGNRWMEIDQDTELGKYYLFDIGMPYKQVQIFITRRGFHPSQYFNQKNHPQNVYLRCYQNNLAARLRQYKKTG